MSQPARAAGDLPGGGNAIGRLLGRGSIYTIATAIQLSAGVLILPALTRVLDPEEMGVVALAIVVQFLFAIVAGLGIPAAIYRTYFRDEQGQERASLLLRRSLIAALAIAAVAELSGPLWSEVITDDGYSLALRLAVWSAVPLAVLTSAQSVLRAGDQAGRFVVTALVASVFAQLAGLVIAIATDLEAAGYVLGLLIGLTAAAALAAAWARILAPPPRETGGVLAAALRVGLPTVPNSLAIYVLAAGDRAVVRHFDGLAAVGRYQVAYAVGALVLALLNAFNNAWRPIVFGEADRRRWQTLAETRAVLYRLSAMVAAMIAIAAPVALAIAAPPRYDIDALSPVTAIVTLSAVPMVAYLASTQVLIWEGRTNVMAWSAPIAAAVDIGLCFILIPPFGLEGAAAATVAAYALLAVLIWSGANRLVRVGGSARPLITAGALAGVGAAASFAMPLDGAWLAVRVVMAAAIGAAAWRYARGRMRARSSGPAAELAVGTASRG